MRTSGEAPRLGLGRGGAATSPPWAFANRAWGGATGTTTTRCRRQDAWAWDSADGREQNEEARLLYEDGLQYGSFGDPAMGDDETIEAQRENEALQRVVAKTSKSVRPRNGGGEWP